MGLQVTSPGGNSVAVTFVGFGLGLEVPRVDEGNLFSSSSSDDQYSDVDSVVERCVLGRCFTFCCSVTSLEAIDGGVAI